MGLIFNLEPNEILNDLFYGDGPSYKGWSKKKLKARIRELEAEKDRGWYKSTVRTGLPVQIWRVLYGGKPSLTRLWHGEGGDQFIWGIGT